jgi:23S rRNA (adenine2503-C2)-methyltransferase
MVVPPVGDLLRIQDVRQCLRTLGANPRHEHRVLRLWSQAKPQDDGPRPIDNFLPASLRAGLPRLERELASLATLHSEHPGEDGARRYVVALHDGQLVESVLMPTGEARQRLATLCVSSQVGCAVGCTFCMTGRSGLLRQLGSAEIVAQVALARALTRAQALQTMRRDLARTRAHATVQRVVFMGMGEPAHNLDNVLEAIDLLGTAGDIGHKNLVLSTVGDERVFEALQQRGADQVRPALALSLHTTRADLRAALLPRAPRLTPEELVEAGERYARFSGYPIQYQWTLLDGVNDTDEEIAGLVQLLRGKYAILNLIPYNAVEGLPYQRPAREAAQAMARRLHERGVLTKLRLSAGQDVDGGCGQLRARAVQARPRPDRRVIAVAAA